MTISLLSTGEFIKQYDIARYFFANKGLSYKWCGPYTKEHKVSFNLPLYSTDRKWVPQSSPLFNYNSDLVKWLNDLNSQNGNKDNGLLPDFGLVILFGENGKKVENFLSDLKFDSYSTLSNRLALIKSEENFDKALQMVYDRAMLFWAKWRLQNSII